MCYHTHYIFLSCGHSVSSPYPNRRSPLCPIRATASGDMAASKRPFSFDPSAIASPFPSQPEPFPAMTPWRLEGPFSPVESGFTDADGAKNEDEDGDAERITNSRGVQTFTADGSETQQGRNRNNGGRGRPGAGQATSQIGTCGQIFIHPYRTYKIEGLCMHCRVGRDVRLASFEVKAIRESVDRESGVGRGGVLGRRVRALSSLPEWVDAEGDGDVKSLPQPLPISASRRRNMHSASSGRPKKPVEHEEQLEEQEQQQQQQSPWQLTMPPAAITKTGLDVDGMRDGEWI